MFKGGKGLLNLELGFRHKHMYLIDLYLHGCTSIAKKNLSADGSWQHVQLPSDVKICLLECLVYRFLVLKYHHNSANNYRW